MAVIDPSRRLDTVVVEITVEPERQEEWVHYIEEMTRRQITADGFVSCSVHRSVDGTRVLEYVQWETPEQRLAALDDDAGHEHLAKLAGISEIRTYVVESVIEHAPRTPGQE